MRVVSPPTVQPSAQRVIELAPPRPATSGAPLMIERSLEDRIRREFFARASQNASRYGVTLDDVVWHLRGAHLPLTPGPARVLAYIDDVVVAVACVRGHPRAWHDAWEKHESSLIRACTARLDHADAVVFTRRFWVDLFLASTAGGDQATGAAATGDEAADELVAPWPLRTYVGVRPLRVWLSDRLLARLEQEIAAGRILVTARTSQRTVARANGSARIAPRDSGREAPRIGRETRLRLVDGG